MTWIQDRVNDARYGRIKIPNMARDLAFDANFQLSLYRTLIGHMPPGYFLYQLSSSGPHQWLIDGHQRLAAILALFDLPVPARGGGLTPPGNTIVQYNLDTQEFRLTPRNTVTDPHGEPWVPTADILMPAVTHHDWRTRLPQVPNAHNWETTSDRRYNQYNLARIVTIDLPEGTIGPGDWRQARHMRQALNTHVCS
jgi:hypothetical protein